MNKKILLLEDDKLLGETIEELLNDEGYDTTWVRCGNDAIDQTYDNKFDLYIFDINVPDITGLELLRSLREAQDTTPSVFISALVDLNSISEAFEIGAYDYIKKPFFPQELLIRVNAKLSNQTSNTLKYKDLEYMPKTKTLKKDGKTLALGDVQGGLFELFLNNIGQVIDNSILMDCLERPSPSALRVALAKLKQTTGMEIKNLRGVGYIVE